MSYQGDHQEEILIKEKNRIVFKGCLQQGGLSLLQQQFIIQSMDSFRFIQI